MSENTSRQKKIMGLLCVFERGNTRGMGGRESLITGVDVDAGKKGKILS